MECLDTDWEKEHRDYWLHSCLWQQIDPAEVIGSSARLLHFKVDTVTQSDVATFTTPFVLEIHTDSEVSGFGSWFKTAFLGSATAPVTTQITLSTEPPSDTHWGQQVHPELLFTTGAMLNIPAL
eukprot:scaffold315300_cov39-Tisochrysis_lutea.AAC.3